MVPGLKGLKANKQNDILHCSHTCPQNPTLDQNSLNSLPLRVELKQPILPLPLPKVSNSTDLKLHDTSWHGHPAYRVRRGFYVHSPVKIDQLRQRNCDTVD